MTDFYQTPAGKAVTDMMPLIMQNSMAEVSQMMVPMMQRAGQMQKEFMAEAQAEKAKLVARSSATQTLSPARS